MNHNSLDLSPADFRQLLDKSSEMVLNQFAELESKKAFHAIPQLEIESWFDESLPEKGMDPEAVLEEVQQKVLDTATNNLGPYMYAYVMAGGSQMSIVAEKFAATINQNVGKWHLAPAISEIEKRVVQWGAEIMGYGNGVGGVLVSGGSGANLAGITVARNVFFEKHELRKKGLFGMQPFTVYASKEVHGCIDKSVEVLGIGSEQLRKINTQADFSIDIDALEAQIREDREKGFLPFCIIGNAGTVNTGAIDDLESIAAIAQKHQLWFHVDGAYGGLVSCLDSIQAKYKGIEKADSVAVDFHKWLYQSFEAGCVMVKNWSILKRAYFKKAAYLDTALEADKGRLDFNEHHFQLSRNAKALKVWMSIKAYGMQRIKAMMQKDIDLASYLADQMEQAADFQLMARSPLAIACFRYVGNLKTEEAIASFNQKLLPALEKDGRVFITGTWLKGQFVIRACLINHRMHRGTVDYLVKVVREVAEKL